MCVGAGQLQPHQRGLRPPPHRPHRPRRHQAGSGQRQVGKNHRYAGWTVKLNFQNFLWLYEYKEILLDSSLQKDEFQPRNGQKFKKKGLSTKRIFTTKLSQIKELSPFWEIGYPIRNTGYYHFGKPAMADFFPIPGDFWLEFKNLLTWWVIYVLDLISVVKKIEKITWRSV